MKRLLRLAAVVALLTCSSLGQTAIVKRNVNLRSDASTASDIVEKLTPGNKLQLIEPSPTSGFYHVSAADGQSGWVWSRNIQVSSESSGSNPTSTPTPTPAPSPGSDLFSQLMNARTAAVGQPLIENDTQVCGPTGDATDPTAQALNNNKNRTDVPADAALVDIDWADLKSLPSNRVSDFVSAPIRVVGFLSHRINVENSGNGESTNCHLTAENEVDWHIYLTNSSAQPISQAVIVETTPRTRPQHKWTTDMLTPIVDSQTKVRISGWLMYDSEHLNVIGTQRATVWEVHPITKIEVQNNGTWVDLDNQ